MRALFDGLQGSSSIPHLLSSRLDRLLRQPPTTPGQAAAAAAGRLLRRAAGSWPEPGSPSGTVTWPSFPVHGRGTFDCSVVVLMLDAELVQPVLPAGCTLGEGDADGKHPVVLFLGRQSDVRPNIWPLPGMAYDEAVFAVPNVFAPDASYAYTGPFVFLPRLWLDKLPPVLAGVFLYGYAKALTRIEQTADSYAIAALAGGARLAEGKFEPAGRGGSPHRFPAWSFIEGCLNQPVLAEPAPGVEIGSVLSFRSHRIESIQPLRARLTIGAGSVPGFAGGDFNAEGLAGRQAAFRMRAHWHLTPPLPRAWLGTGAAPAAAPVPSPRRTPPGPDVAPPAPLPPAGDLQWAHAPKRRIAVLGGGVGALVAAWALTKDPDWRERYDLTVYQIGWRLGGKGASGRNAAQGQRIEEHGLHVWAGFYENAFRVMRDCYAGLNRPAGSPLATIEDAFKPQSRTTLEERVGDAWTSWNIDTLTGPGMPGDGDPFGPEGPLDYVPALVAGLAALVEQAPRPLQAAFRQHNLRLQPGMRAAVAAARASGHDPRHAVRQARPPGAPPPEAQAAEQVLDSVLAEATAVAQHAARPGPHRPAQLAIVVQALRAVRAHPELALQLRDLDDNARRIAELFDLGFATVIGMIVDGLIFRGFDAADGEEWRDWLRRHGAQESTLQSAVVRATYDYVFGFIDGDIGSPALAAGTTTHGLLRLMLTYKGALFWMMQAGMGDTVFTPLYLALRERGVQFAFFHKVDALRLAADRRSVERIELTRQARPIGGEYYPLVTVRDLECWPSEPRWDQIVDGDALRDAGIDLEAETGVAGGEPVTLTRGQEFDEVVLGISLGSFPRICGELIAASPRWDAMVRGVRTVSTLGTQLWLRPDLDGLGWTAGPTIATAYAEPLDTWADMSRLVDREVWPAHDAPGSIIYLCGPLQDGPAGGVPADRVRTIARDWLSHYSGHPWPLVAAADGALDLNQLYRRGGGDAEARFQAQYFRANVSGSARYVQSVPGSTELRIRPGESGFDNLYLAGDWVRTGLNAGCVEVATMGGLAAAAAVSGRRIEIIDGEQMPMAATLAEHALDTVHGVARIEAAVIVASLPIETARRMLPPGLVFAPQPMTSASRYPVVFICARQRNARPNIVPVGLSYHEVIVMLPAVRESGAEPTRSRAEVFAYMARLYVDSLPMLLIGRVLYGYAKDFAHVLVKPNSVAVGSAVGATPILAAELRSRGGPMLARDSAHCGDVAWILERTILSRAPLGGWRRSRYAFSLESASLQPLEVSLTVYPALRPSLGPGPLTLRTGEEGIISAFRLWADTSLSNPAVGLCRPD